MKKMQIKKNESQPKLNFPNKKITIKYPVIKEVIEDKISNSKLGGGGGWSEQGG